MAALSTIKQGDTVTVSYIREVRETFDGLLYIRIDPAEYEPTLVHLATLTDVTVEKVVPKWIDGDVVVVTDDDRESTMTYLRKCRGQWSAPSGSLLTDADITAAYTEGQAKHLVRNGKVV